MRVSRLEDIVATVVSNQTQILRLQQEHSERLANVEHRLANLEQLMTRVLEELVAIKEILASSRGMGFVPEPDDGD
ncbi:MAG: hypothetical protein OXG78_13465 [Chloroflexi bacterium]|nr:hypothetical protein [Chloroflexota bacterium]